VVCGVVTSWFTPSAGFAEPPRSSTLATGGSDEWVDRAADYVRGEVAYAVRASGGKRTFSPGEVEVLLAATAVRYVSNRLSSLRYGFLVRMQGREAPTSPAMAVELGIGSCGNHIATTHALVRRLGLKTRSVQFYWIGSRGSASHILAEVHAGGAWRLFDVTWGTWFTRSAANPLDIVSYAELEGDRLESFHRHIDVTSPAYVTARLSGIDPFEYLRAWDIKSVVIGMNGTVWLPGQATDEEDGEQWIPRDAPNFAGRTLDHGELASGTVQLALVSNHGHTRGLVFNDAVVACRKGEVVVTGDGRAVSRSTLPAGSARSHFRITWPEAVQARTFGVRVESPDDAPCYFVFRSISALSH
jgi:hypothetical protein